MKNTFCCKSFVFKFIFLLIFFSYNTFGINLTNEEIQYLKENPILTIYTDGSYSPIEFFDNNGIYQGISSDYLIEISKLLNIKFNIYYDRDYLSKIDEKKSHLMTSVAITNIKLQKYIFSDFYLDFPAVIVSRNRIKTAISEEMLANKTIALVKGYSSYDYLSDKYPELNFNLVHDISTGLKMVSLGIVDYFIDNIAPISFF
ncbi:MAG: transporter substrate-binding domain-containing protein [Candidatus Muirbacterium halophilum]|nr:transporter substrate-binding domain-containing protein [Candidatus Muirbacterium halophilum]MCK9474359.1 transporter substrate-binding domain-containing protein [Candidatus Muirbacterium halophilum]